MIKYEKKLDKLQTFTQHVFENTDVVRQYDVVWVKKEDVRKLLLRQIDEDNKRFLGYVGKDEVLNNDPHDVFEDADKIARNQLRAELRDKVNKNENIRTTQERNAKR